MQNRAVSPVRSRRAKATLVWSASLCMLLPACGGTDLADSQAAKAAKAALEDLQRVAETRDEHTLRELLTSEQIAASSAAGRIQWDRLEERAERASEAVQNPLRLVSDDTRVAVLGAPESSSPDVAPDVAPADNRERENRETEVWLVSFLRKPEGGLRYRSVDKLSEALGAEECLFEATESRLAGFLGEALDPAGYTKRSAPSAFRRLCEGKLFTAEEFFQAIERGDVEEVRRFLEAGMNPETQFEGQTPLETTALSLTYDASSEVTSRRVEIFHLLLKAGAELPEAEMALYIGAGVSRQVAEELLTMLGHEEWSREDIAFSLSDRTQVRLPRSELRNAVPADAAVVSISGNGQIRVSTGNELSVPVAGTDDVLSFAASWMSGRRTRPTADPQSRIEPVEAVLVEIPAGGLSVDGRPMDLGSLGSYLEPKLDRNPDKPLLLLPSRVTRYGRVIEVLDHLLQLSADEGPTLEHFAIPAPRNLRLQQGVSIVGREVVGDAIVAIKADAGLPWPAINGVLEALRRARVDGVVFLTSADGDPGQDPSALAAPEPGVLPPFLPGGIPWSLRSEHTQGTVRVAVPDPTVDVPEPLRFFEDEESESDLPETDVVFDIPESAPPQDPDDPIMVGGDVRAPVKVYDPQPEYTEMARKARIQGVVIVQATIDKQGNVTAAKILKGLPMGLDQAALEAVEQWRFEPATLHGEPVAVYYNLTLNFTLSGP